MGRPTVMTPEVIEALEEAFKWGCTDQEACLNADIADDTLYKYQREYPEFIKRKEQLKQNPIKKARKAVFDALDKNPDLALKFLERKKKDEFSTKSETDLHVKELPKPLLGGYSVSTNDSNQQNTSS